MLSNIFVKYQNVDNNDFNFGRFLSIMTDFKRWISNDFDWIKILRLKKRRMKPLVLKLVFFDITLFSAYDDPLIRMLKCAIKKVIFSSAYAVIHNADTDSETEFHQNDNNNNDKSEVIEVACSISLDYFLLFVCFSFSFWLNIVWTQLDWYLLLNCFLKPKWRYSFLFSRRNFKKNTTFFTIFGENEQYPMLQAIFQLCCLFLNWFFCI